MDMQAMRKGMLILMSIKHHNTKSNKSGFICQNPMLIRGAGLHIMVRRNYAQDVLGDLVVLDPVVLLTRTLNTASSSCEVRSKKGV